MHEFTPWPKTARLFRDIVVTEKLDGTNSAIHITKGAAVLCPSSVFEAYPLKLGEVFVDGYIWFITAQSRKRIITPGKTTDNYGFAGWVHDNAADLVRILGEGLHFGEWWGRGIQRGYGLEGKRFSLFNTTRWDAVDEDSGTSMKSRAEQSDIIDQIDVVPTLYVGPFSESVVWQIVDDLRTYGSVAAPGFENAEGVCIFHTASGRVFKVTSDHRDGNPQRLASGPLNDVRRDAGKWEAA
ncbi:RNA ligase family protein [Streptomyces sp. SID5910]|uniref:RNA ligase family protein n=1 Tax=Streptomyces sp. SID5910 TaxID=2690312 RepID=UPI00136DE8A1|nr:RNA ligase family protein [Streptomyces sp. SID5910]MYR43082.1 hypothetical protein [Streptomyces sp. SID5910]